MNCERHMHGWPTPSVRRQSDVSKHRNLFRWMSSDNVPWTSGLEALCKTIQAVSGLVLILNLLLKRFSMFFNPFRLPSFKGSDSFRAPLQVYYLSRQAFFKTVFDCSMKWIHPFASVQQKNQVVCWWVSKRMSAGISTATRAWWCNTGHVRRA